MRKRWAYGLLTAVILAASCSGERELFSPDDVGVLGVYAMLYVDQPPPAIVVYRAQSPAEPFDPRRAAERGATVTMSHDETTVFYQETFPGVYRPAGVSGPEALVVRPETTYRLEVVSTSGERLTSTTTTPPRLSVADWVLLDDDATAVERRLRTFAEVGDGVFTAPENQLVYTEGLLEAWLTPVVAAGYQAGIYALDPDSGFVLDPEFLDEEDFGRFEPNIASPPIVNSEKKIRLPWFAIYFKGRYKIKIFAVDRNWFDLARSLPELSGAGGGFGGNTGDNFERPIFHVSGGIGIFGSASVDSVGFTVHPRP
jgi:hypothetical protein